MPEWVKVLAGCLALMIGASAPALIVDSLQLRQQRSPEIHRAAKQEAGSTTDLQETTNSANNPANQPATILPAIAPPDQKKERENQRDGSEQESESFSALGYKFKVTDFLVAVFTGLLVLVGFIQCIMLRKTMIVTRCAAITSRDSADTATKALIASTRAWIAPVSVIIKRIFINDHRIAVSADFVFKNIGKFPALNVTVRPELFILEDHVRQGGGKTG